MSQTKAQLIDNLVSPITGALGSASAPTFSFTADPNTGIYSPGADQLAVTTGGTGRLFIDSSGRLLVGTSTARSNFFGTTLSSLTQTEGTGGSTARGALSVINNDVSNNPPYVLLGRSGAATLGSNAAVVSGSRLGTLTFHGADGTSFIEAATVAGEVDGTPGTNDMPGRLVLSTTSDGASSPTERLRIDSSGRVGIGTTSPTDAQLYVNSSATYGVRINHATLPLQSFLVNGTQAFTIGANSGGGGAFYYGAGNVEAMRIDSSGRLLVGTSTTSEVSRVVFQGNSTLTTGTSIVKLTLGNASPGSTDELGKIQFADSSHVNAAQIAGLRDGGTWTSGSSQPTALVFSTTASGSAIPTERVRITNAGNVGIGTSSPVGQLSVGASPIGFNAGSIASPARGNIFYDTDGSGWQLRIGKLQSGTFTPQMTFQDNGSVGIGTTSPVFKFHVDQGTDDGQSFTVRNDEVSLNVGAFGTGSSYSRQVLINGSRADAGSYPQLRIAGQGGIIFAVDADAERARIDTSGRLLVGTSTSLDTFLAQVNYNGGSSNGVYIRSSATSGDGSYMLSLNRQSAPNNSTPVIFYSDSSAGRFELRNNGGLANYQANNVNLSDINTKKDISPAAGTWDCIKEWEIVNYRYKDQLDDADLNLGVIAQQVAESCPEVITIFQEAKEATEDAPAREERLGVKEQQMYWMAIKALQEAQVRIEQLEAKVAALESA